MATRRTCVLIAVALLLCAVPAAVSAQQQADAVTQLLRRVEGLVKAGDADAFAALAVDAERARVREFASSEIASAARLCRNGIANNFAARCPATGIA